MDDKRRALDNRLLYLAVTGDHDRRVRKYLRLHEGMSDQKAREEARRITDMLWQAYQFEQDSKKITKQASKILESPEDKERRLRAAQIVGRLDQLRADYAGTGIITTRITRWFSEIRRSTRTVRPPSEKRLKHLEDEVQRLQAHLEQAGRQQREGR